jgi:hypothetical protein
LHHDNARSRIPFFRKGFFYQKQNDCRFPPSILIWLGHLWIFFFPNWKAATLTRLRWSRQNRRRCWTRLPWCI